MIKRIVKMSFHEHNIEAFKTIFKTNWKSIKSFEGCQHVELLQDAIHPGLFFTYSHWESEVALENYRNSTLFKSVWGSTKVLFNDKPQAWSLKTVGF